MSAETKALKSLVLKELLEHQQLEHELESLETKISLLIQNRKDIQKTSANSGIFEFKKKDSQNVPTNDLLPDLFDDASQAEFVWNLLYLLQTRPKLLSRAFVSMSAPSISTTDTDTLCFRGFSLKQVQVENLQPYADIVARSLFGKIGARREEFWFMKLLECCIEQECIPERPRLLDTITDPDGLVYLLLESHLEHSGFYAYVSALKLIRSNAILTEMPSYRNLFLSLDGWFENCLNLRNSLMGDVTRTTKSLKALERRDKLSDLPRIKPDTNSRRVEADNDTESEPRRSKRQRIIEKLVKEFVRKLGKMAEEDCIPLALRFACKQVKSVFMKLRIPEDDTDRAVGSFIYGLVVHPALAALEEKELSCAGGEKRNVPILRKVMSKLFLRSRFEEDSMLADMNPWLLSAQPLTSLLFGSLVKIPSLEEALEYSEEAEKLSIDKPFVVMNTREIALLGRLAIKNAANFSDESSKMISALARNNALPKAINISSRSVQVDLTTNLLRDYEIQLMQDDKGLILEETREMIVSVFRDVALRSGESYTLLDILERAESQQHSLERKVRKIRKNIKDLESSGIISAVGNYDGLMREVAFSAINHEKLQVQREDTLLALNSKYKTLAARRIKLQKRISEFNTYIHLCRENSAKNRTSSTNKSKQYTLAEWTKKGIVLPPKPPIFHDPKTKFRVTMPQVGTFDLEIRANKRSIGTGRVQLEDLLQLRPSHGMAAFGSFEFYVEKLLDTLNESFLS